VDLKEFIQKEKRKNFQLHLHSNYFKFHYYFSKFEFEWRWRKKFRIFGTLVEKIATQDMKYDTTKRIKVFSAFLFGVSSIV